MEFPLNLKVLLALHSTSGAAWRGVALRGATGNKVLMRGALERHNRWPEEHCSGPARPRQDHCRFENKTKTNNKTVAGLRGASFRVKKIGGYG